MIRILLAEDQAMMRGALAVLLDLEPDLEVVAQVSRADAIVPEAHRVAPDVALLDIELPGGNGIDAARDLRAAMPACAVIIVTTFGRPGYLRRAIDAGARGFLVKDGPVEALADASVRSWPAGPSSTPSSPPATAAGSDTDSRAGRRIRGTSRCSWRSKPRWHCPELLRTEVGRR